MNHFERLGLSRRFSVDLVEVEREYLARSRDVHPDFHTLASPTEQQASLERSAALNEAYLTLKDPFRRADYLLGLIGGPTAQQEKNLDQLFLMEMMDLRERIDAARSGSPDELAVLETELQSRESESLQRVASEFAWLDTNPDHADRPKRLAGLRRTLNAWKTIRSLLRDLHMN